MASEGRRPWRLRRPTTADAETVAQWPSSAAEAQQWVSHAAYPFPASKVVSWWEVPDVRPWLLVDAVGTPMAYGEEWDDPEEDEVELARLIVDPRRRREGIGTVLVNLLLDQARTGGRSTCFLRVAPDNIGALLLYRSVGFGEVEPSQAEVWNQRESVDYVWLSKPLNAAKRAAQQGCGR